MRNNNMAEKGRKHQTLFALVIVLAAAALLTGVAAFFSSGAAEDGEEGGLSLFSSSPVLGQVDIQGEILDAAETVAFIKTLRQDDEVKGVLLRINSPGGAFGPSQELYQAVKRLAKAKPVVASFASVAASGGYYAACPASLIVSNPGSLTGSIGVVAQYANVEELLGKIGVRFQSFTSGPLKDAGSPLRPLTPEDKAYLEGIIRDLNEQFSGDVAKERDLDPKSVAAIADGRAMTGRRALELGLVDELGSYEDAMGRLKKLCDLTGSIPVRKGPKKKEKWMEMLFSRLEPPLRDLTGRVLFGALTGPDAQTVPTPR